MSRRDPPGGSQLPSSPIPPCLSANEQGLVSLTVHVQPRASRSGISGLHDGRLKLAITAPPVEGQANSQVIALLAKLFRVSKGAVALESGSLGRSKRLTIAGIDLERAATILAPLL